MRSGEKCPEGDACVLAAMELEFCVCGWKLPIGSTPHTKEDVEGDEDLPPIRYDMGVILVCPDCHETHSFTFSKKDARTLSS